MQRALRVSSALHAVRRHKPLNLPSSRATTYTCVLSACTFRSFIDQKHAYERNKLSPFSGAMQLVLSCHVPHCITPLTVRKIEAEGPKKLLPLHSAVLLVRLVWILIHLFSHLTSLWNFWVVFQEHWGTATKPKPFIRHSECRKQQNVGKNGGWGKGKQCIVSGN